MQQSYIVRWCCKAAFSIHFYYFDVRVSFRPFWQLEAPNRGASRKKLGDCRELSRSTIPNKSRIFIRPRYTQVRSMGPSLSNSVYLCANLTDVTLADEDTNSILTNNANRAIKGNVAMQVTQPGGQLCKECKWCHLMTKF